MDFNPTVKCRIKVLVSVTYEYDPANYGGSMPATLEELRDIDSEGIANLLDDGNYDIVGSTVLPTNGSDDEDDEDDEEDDDEDDDDEDEDDEDDEEEEAFLGEDNS